jgi:hypothetical protein
MKMCKKCGETKEFDFFYKRSRSKDGYTSRCKNCIYESEKKYKKSYNKDWRLKNKEAILIKEKEYRENNKEFLKSRRNDNKDKIKEKKRIYYQNRRKNDSMYRLSHNLRNIIYKSCKSRKSSFRTEKIIGCSFEDFKLHLECKFESWMTWENYGKYNGELEYGWDIDHIIPLCSAINEEELIKLNHFTNLQPLCSKVNRDIKRKNLTWVSEVSMFS